MSSDNKASLLIDMLEERKHDKKRGIKKSEFQHPLIELNIRIAQYVQQFVPFTLDYLIVQTLHDFRNEIKLLQQGRIINKREAVAIWSPKNRPDLVENIYVDEFVMKSDFASGVRPEIFSFKEPMKKE